MAATQPTPIDQKSRGPEAPLAFRSAPVTTVAIAAAWPSARAGLRAMLAAEPRLAAVVLSPAELQLPEESPALGALSAQTSIILIDQTGLAADRLRPLVQTANEDGIPMLWLGRPDGIDEIATAGSPWGVLSPDADQETLIAAIHALAAGLTVADPSFLPPPKTERSAPPPPVTLTAREQEVLELVAAGLPNKAIARALGISDHTAKFHVSALLGKLNAASRTEAVTIATRTGLLSV
jgi:DNA-binding NarL/FixJ family response regulator